jgi:hypothetical protein
VAAKDRRAEILRDLLPKSYPILFQGGIEHLTRERLDTALSENYGAHRDTQKKARSFFFRACEFAGIPLPATLTMRPAGGNVQVGNQLRLQTQESGSPTGGNGNMQETSHGNGGHGVDDMKDYETETSESS